jgi:hypothetical protein
MGFAEESKNIWDFSWHVADEVHVSASFVLKGMLLDEEPSEEDMKKALGDEAMINELAGQVEKKLGHVLRVEDFNPGVLKEEFVSILREQVADLPPEQPLPEWLDGSSKEEVMQLVSAIIMKYMQAGAPEDYDYEIPQPGTKPTVH